MRHTSLAVIGLSAFVIASCSSEVVSLSVKPAQVDQARELAVSLADRAKCSDFEDLVVTGAKGTWIFSCQKGSVTFDISVFASDEAKQKWQQESGSQLHLSEHYHAVTVAPAPGQVVSAAFFEPFRE